MPISNRQAYALKQRGRSVIVECAECGERVWTADASYLHGADEWYCDECDDELVEDIIDEMVDG